MTDQTLSLKIGGQFLKKKRLTTGDVVFNIVIGILLLFIAALVIYPFWFMIIASFSDPNAVNAGLVILLPKSVTLDGYRRIFSDSLIWRGYANSIYYTCLGVCVNLLLTIPTAFALSRKELVGGNIIMKLMVFTMYFYGGIIPLYIVVSGMHLLNTVWSLVLPSAIVTYYLIIARTFFVTSIPEELKEAAFLDGCDYFKFFFHVVLPLSKAVIAVMVLFYATKMWNGYYDALMYINKETQFPLQLVLRDILISSQAASMTDDAASLTEAVRTVNLIKYGVIIVSSVPMLLLYPFIQKYFTKGVMLGAVKG